MFCDSCDTVVLLCVIDSLWRWHRDCSSSAHCLFAIARIHTQRLYWSAGCHLAFHCPPSLPLLPAVCQGLLYLPSAELCGMFVLCIITAEAKIIFSYVDILWLISFSALSLFIVWHQRYPTCKKISANFPRGLSLELTEKGNQVKTGWPRLTWKVAVNTEEVFVTNVVRH